MKYIYIFFLIFRTCRQFHRITNDKSLWKSVDISSAPISMNNLWKLLFNSNRRLKFLKSLQFSGNNEKLPADFFHTLSFCCPELESLKMARIIIPDNLCDMPYMNYLKLWKCKIEWWKCFKHPLIHNHNLKNVMMNECLFVRRCSKEIRNSVGWTTKWQENNKSNKQLLSLTRCFRIDRHCIKFPTTEPLFSCTICTIMG